MRESEGRQLLGKLERETGIEPATNSLEGCDSTTELLPPLSACRGAHSHGSCQRFAFARAAAPFALCQVPSDGEAGGVATICFQTSAGPLSLPRLPFALCHLASAGETGERRLVARGGFEPPKPLGRQIYSLLRLTASLPRRYRAGPVPARATAFCAEARPGHDA